MNFNGLPGEIIFCILYQACETPQFHVSEKLDSRLRIRLVQKPKPFAVIARNVCTEWRRRIDGSPAFLINRLFLSILESDISPQGSAEFLKVIGDLQKRLASPQFRRCDLVISLSTSGGLITSPTISSSGLETLCRGLSFFITYQKHISSITIRTSADYVLKLLLSLLSAYMVNACRLFSLCVLWESAAINPIFFENIMTLDVNPVLESIFGKPQKYLSDDGWLSLTHHCDLDFLTIPHTSWLDGRLKLPSSLGHVYIHYVPFDSDLLKLDTPQSSMRSIVSACVIHGISSLGGSQSADRSRWHNIRLNVKLRFANLTHLTLNGVYDAWTVHFLKSVEFPRLTYVDIFLVDHPGQEVRPLEFLERMTATPRVPHLKTLKMRSIPVTLNALACFYHFAHPNVETLILNWSSTWTQPGRPVSVEVGLCLYGVLIRYQPKQLMVDCGYFLLQIVLSTMALTRLEDLNLKLVNQALSFQGLYFNDVTMIYAPLLTSLGLTGFSDTQTCKFLKRLNTDRLRTIAASIYTEPSLRDMPPNENEPSDELEIELRLHSVRQVAYSIMTVAPISGLHTLFALTPNVQELRIHLHAVGLSAFGVYTLRTLLSDFISIMTARCPRNDAEALNFRHITKLTVSLETGINVDCEFEEFVGIMEDLLNTRAGLGAVHLLNQSYDNSASPLGLPRMQYRFHAEVDK